MARHFFQLFQGNSSFIQQQIAQTGLFYRAHGVYDRTDVNNDADLFFILGDLEGTRFPVIVQKLKNAYQKNVSIFPFSDMVPTYLPTNVFFVFSVPWFIIIKKGTHCQEKKAFPGIGVLFMVFFLEKV